MEKRDLYEKINNNLEIIDIDLSRINETLECNLHRINETLECNLNKISDRGAILRFLILIGLIACPFSIIHNYKNMIKPLL